MANANESATQSQINELMAAIGQKLSNLSAEEIGRLYGKKDQFVEQCGVVATKLAQPKPVAQPAHETIRIPVTVGDRKYLACGFLKASERGKSVKRTTMLERTAKIENTKPIDDAEWQHLSENRKDFDSVPELARYYLATDRRLPDFFGYLSCFRRHGREWCDDSRSVGRRWRVNVLVLRRCT